MEEKSKYLKDLIFALDMSEKIYSVQYQSLCDFVIKLTAAPGANQSFKAPGAYRPFRADLSYKDTLEAAQRSLASSAVAATQIAHVAMSAFLFSLGGMIYENLSEMDQSWLRPDMIETIIGVDPMTCVASNHLNKLWKIVAPMTNPWAPTEPLNQDEFFAMLSGLKVFAEDFETAVLLKHDDLKINEGGDYERTSARKTRVQNKRSLDKSEKKS